MVPLLALVDDFGLRRDRAVPRLDSGQACQLALAQRQELVQLLDQGAWGRCAGASSSTRCGRDREPATMNCEKGATRLVALL